MAIVRTFWFINSLGNKYLLTDRNSSINIINPSGLGFLNNVVSVRIGNKAKKVSEQYSMPQVSGEIHFHGDNESNYQNYFELMSFLSHKPIKFFYQTPNTTKTYYIDCEVIQLDKTENSEQGIMLCPMIIQGLSFWKSGETNVQYFERGTFEEGKHYPLVREYAYSGYGFNNMPIVNNNTMDSPFIFEIRGEVENPVLSFYQNNERYGVIKLLGTFTYIRVNTDEANQELYLEYNGTPLSNPIQYQDFTVYDGISQITFFRLKSGNNALTFNADNVITFDGEVKLTWEDEFLSV